jgi:hypothetical protein
MSKLKEFAKEDYLAAVLVQLIERSGHDVLELEQCAEREWHQQQHQQEHPDPIGAAVSMHDDKAERAGQAPDPEPAPPPAPTPPPEDEDLSPQFLDVAALPDGARISLQRSAWVYEDHYEQFIDRGGQVDVNHHRLTTKRRTCIACGSDITGQKDCRTCAIDARKKAAADAAAASSDPPPNETTLPPIGSRIS